MEGKEEKEKEKKSNFQKHRVKLVLKNLSKTNSENEIFIMFELQKKKLIFPKFYRNFKK